MDILAAVADGERKTQEKSVDHGLDSKQFNVTLVKKKDSGFSISAVEIQDNTQSHHIIAIRQNGPLSGDAKELEDRRKISDEYVKLVTINNVPTKHLSFHIVLFLFGSMDSGNRVELGCSRIREGGQVQKAVRDFLSSEKKKKKRKRAELRSRKALELLAPNSNAKRKKELRQPDNVPLLSCPF